MLVELGINDDSLECTILLDVKYFVDVIEIGSQFLVIRVVLATFFVNY
jgi:hypothetical protein